MKNETEKKKIRIFGLDYGRGTMAGFYIDEGADALDPHAIMDSRGEPSGFAVMHDGTTRVGKNMITISDRDFPHVKEFHVNVKEMPHGNEREDALQIQYARAWRERFLKKYPQLFNDGYEEYWFIGCPTGWRSKKLVDNYAKIFTAAGFQNVVIVPESNAAMMCAQKRFEFAKHVDKDVGVLCIDLGAYSADSTYVRPGESVISYGGYVGASLVEKMIVAENLNDEYRIAGQPYATPEALEVIGEEYRRNEKFRTFVLNYARDLKELYYSKVADGAAFNAFDFIGQVPLPMYLQERLGVRFFAIYVNDLMTNAIIHDRSVKSVLGEEFDALPDEVRKEFGDKSWSACLKGFLEKTLEICPDFATAARSGDKRACLIVTGGASKMLFVEDVICEVMPKASLYKDEDPMSTIAKGLVYFGPGKLKAIAFDREFERLRKQDKDGNPVEKDNPNWVLNEVLSDAHNKLGVDLISNTVGKIIEAVYNAVISWRNSNIDSNEIHTTALAEFCKWFEGEMVDDYNNKFAPACRNCIVDGVNSLFKPLLQEYSDKEHDLGDALLVVEDLSLKYVDCFLKWWQAQYEGFKEKILEDKEFFKQFPNPGFFGSIFGPGRGQFLGAVANVLQKRYETWAEEYWKILKSEFDSREVYSPFCYECLLEILSAIDKAKKTKLGELIVEESFDDDVVTPEVVD